MADSAAQAEKGGSGTVDAVYAHVAAAIRDGRLVAGQRLIEAELAAELGVGRNAVREGLQRLAASGIVALERHRGAVIPRLSRADVAELTAVREVLEGLAARRAAGHSDADALGALHRGMQKAAEAGDADAYRVGNTRFHAWLVQAAASPRLAGLIANLSLPIVWLQFRVLLDRANMAASSEDHAAILQAVRDGDADAAEAAMRRHIRRGGEAVQALPDALFKP